MMFTSIKKTQKGFTLIELLVVIAIIGILSSVVLASLSTARQKSRDAKRISDIGQIQLALELYFDANQSYPSTTPIASTATIEGGVQVLMNAGFLPKVPLPPAGPVNNKYFYRGILAAGGECLSTVSCTTYTLASTLERSDNTVLSADADSTGTSGFGAYANAPGAGVAGGVLYTTYPDCTTNTAGTDQCYDLKP